MSLRTPAVLRYITSTWPSICATPCTCSRAFSTFPGSRKNTTSFSKGRNPRGHQTQTTTDSAWNRTARPASARPAADKASNERTKPPPFGVNKRTTRTEAGLSHVNHMAGSASTSPARRLRTRPEEPTVLQWPPMPKRGQAADRDQLEPTSEQSHDGPEWLKHRRAMKGKFPVGWRPPKRISREAMDLLRTLHRSAPDKFTTPLLAEQFKISAEAVRRILKSKFQLSDEEKAKRERKRKEERDRLHAERGTTWAGDVSGEQRELAELRRMSDAQGGDRGSGREGSAEAPESPRGGRYSQQ